MKGSRTVQGGRKYIPREGWAASDAFNERGPCCAEHGGQDKVKSHLLSGKEG